MPVFAVILDASLRGASAFSTDDTIEADDYQEAERKAISQWKAVEPDFTFRPLLTLQKSK